MSEPASRRAGPGVLFRTLAGLPPSQIFHRITRPLRGTTRRMARAWGAGPGPIDLAAIGTFAAPPLPDASWTPPGAFRFLGVERDFGADIDWTAAPSRLWGYHLHYLDGLRDDLPIGDRLRLLDSWIAANPFAARPGWESFPTSLRLVNAFELLLGAGDAAFAPRRSTLALQSWWLDANMETDLGANHLFKNALALTWAGRCLRGRSADGWRSRGDAILGRELASQILDDGFHVERTPGYHAILVDDLIRLERLLRATGEIEGAFGRQVVDARRRTTAALLSIVHPDGEIPLFNDSAFGQAPKTAWLLDRAAELDAGSRSAANPLGAPSAGIHRLAGERSVVLFDAGEIGCEAQPGHAHADTLSYELSFGRTRVVVDAGVFDYAPSETRAYARATRAHSTLELDGLDQSEMWGAFRVGRRARPFAVSRSEREGRMAIEASHDGYRHLPGGPVHRRRLEHLGGDVWRVEDDVHGRGEHRGISLVRIHPDFAVGRRDTNWVEAASDDVAVRVVAEPPVRIDVEAGRYFPSFGVEQRCLVLRLEAAGPLPLRIGYRLELSTRS